MTPDPMELAKVSLEWSWDNSVCHIRSTGSDEFSYECRAIEGVGGFRFFFDGVDKTFFAPTPDNLAGLLSEAMLSGGEWLARLSNLIWIEKVKGYHIVPWWNNQPEMAHEN